MNTDAAWCGISGVVRHVDASRFYEANARLVAPSPRVAIPPLVIGGPFASGRAVGHARPPRCFLKGNVMTVQPGYAVRLKSTAPLYARGVRGGVIMSVTETLQQFLARWADRFGMSQAELKAMIEASAGWPEGSRNEDVLPILRVTDGLGADDGIEFPIHESQLVA